MRGAGGLQRRRPLDLVPGQGGWDARASLGLLGDDGERRARAGGDQLAGDQVQVGAGRRQHHLGAAGKPAEDEKLGAHPLGLAGVDLFGRAVAQPVQQPRAQPLDGGEGLLRDGRGGRGAEGHQRGIGCRTAAVAVGAAGRSQMQTRVAAQAHQLGGRGVQRRAALIGLRRRNEPGDRSAWTWGHREHRPGPPSVRLGPTLRRCG